MLGFIAVASQQDAGFDPVLTKLFTALAVIALALLFNHLLKPKNINHESIQ